MYVNMDSIIVFLMLSALTLFVWYGIAHIDSYYWWKNNGIKPEYKKEFTFIKYTASEIKRLFTGKGLF